jgi:hypothetical protein
MRYVLLALADHADPSGFAFPSIALLADKCVLTGRSVIGAITQLERQHWITKTKKGKANQYQINLEKLGIGAVVSREKDSGDIGEQTSREDASHEIHCSPYMKSTASIGEIHCNPPGPPNRSNRHEPPVEPSGKVPQRPSGDKRQPDPRFSPFRAEIFTHWPAHLGEPPWDASDAKALSRLLAANPNLTVEGFKRLLRNRGESEGVNLTQRPRAWLERVTDYAMGPLNQYNKPTSKPMPVRQSMLSIAEERSYAAK